MSIRPDTWINKMAREYGMIEPFVEEQVRVVDGRPVVSYGMSSFGYEVIWSEFSPNQPSMIVSSQPGSSSSSRACRASGESVRGSSV